MCGGPATILPSKLTCIMAWAPGVLPLCVCVCVCVFGGLSRGGGVGKVALGSFYMFFPVFYVMHFTYNHTIHTCMYQYGSRNERSPLSRFTR